jgi:hypothetical protein
VTVTVITVGLDHYTQQPRWDIPQAAQSRSRVEALFVEHGAVAEDWTLSANSREIADVLDKWKDRFTDSHIIYWVGHGEYSDDGYLAALADSNDPLSNLKALNGSHLKDALRAWTRNRDINEPDSWLLLILDTCGSASGAWELYSSFNKPPPNVGVIAAAEGAAFVGHLAADLELVLAGFTGNDSAGISLKELARRLEDHLEDDGDTSRVLCKFGPSAVLRNRADSPPPVQAPVDVYNEMRELLAAVVPEVRNHFYAKAQGAEIGELAWHFVGREQERARISAWLRDAPGGMFAVSGVAGSGKSALLGMVLATSDEALIQALTSIGYGAIPERTRPVGVSFNAVLHLSGRTVADTVAALSAALDLGTGDDVDTLLETLRTRGDRRLTVLVDAVDESRDPLTIAATLRRLAAVPGVRVLVGTRQSMHEDPDHPIPRDSAILDTLTAQRIIKLPRDPDAVREYVATRLKQARPEPNAPQLMFTDDQINGLADIIAEYEQPFLFARLAVAEVIAEPELVENAELLAQMLDSGHSGIFGHAVSRLARTAPEVEALLHVLTYARGNGFPRTGGIWAIAASALTETPLKERHINNALTLAAPFIMQDSEFGHSVYRLAHRTFAEWYLRNDAP